MEGETGGEFPDWEVLHRADVPSLAKTSESLSGNSENFEVIVADSDSEGIICSNYFSLNDQGRYIKTAGECDVNEEGSVESDNPSWIDPGLDDRHGGKNSVEFLFDSGSDLSEEPKVIDVDARTGLGAAEIFTSQASFGEMIGESENLYKLDSGDCKYCDMDRKGELDFPEVVKIQMDVKELDEIRTRDKDLGKFWSDSCGDELVSVKFGELAKEPEMRSDHLVGVNDRIADSGGENGRSAEKENVSSVEEEEEEQGDGKPVVDEEKKKAVWWKVPFEVLKYCVFRVSPVWSFSVAAAVMGFLILGRRLFKLKRKSQSLHLNVTVDNKKVTQFVNSAARLNEAFSLVKRVPMVRPPLPAAGAGVNVNMWPAMSVR